MSRAKNINDECRSSDYAWSRKGAAAAARALLSKPSPMVATAFTNGYSQRCADSCNNAPKMGQRTSRPTAEAYRVNAQSTASRCPAVTLPSPS